MKSFKQRPLKNALIDLVAPASSVTTAQIKESVRQVENMGFQARVLAHPVNFFLFSADDKQRFLYLKKALTNQDSEAVWCLRGGYGCQRLMPFLFKMTKPSKMKCLIGYSDVSVLHNFLNLKWGWPSLHFPVLADLRYVSLSANKRFQALISGSLKKQVFKDLYLLNLSSVRKIKSFLTGGNLTVIQSSIGTPWQFSFQNKILFLEDVGESAYRLDRALWQMQKAGVFKGIKALVLGTFTSVKNVSTTSPAKKMEEKQMKKVFELFAHRVSFPVLWGVPCGHGIKKEILPFMTPCELQVNSRGKAQLQINSPFV